MLFEFDINKMLHRANFERDSRKLERRISLTATFLLFHEQPGFERRTFFRPGLPLTTDRLKSVPRFDQLLIFSFLKRKSKDHRLDEGYLQRYRVYYRSQTLYERLMGLTNMIELKILMSCIVFVGV